MKSRQARRRKARKTRIDHLASLVVEINKMKPDCGRWLIGYCGVNGWVGGCIHYRPPLPADERSDEAKFRQMDDQW